MRRVNFKFLLGTVICVLVIIGGVHALHVYQYGKQADHYKRQVEASRESKNREERIQHLRRYTALVRDDADSLDQLGTLLVETGRLREANLPLATALNLYANEDKTSAKVTETREKLVDLALRTGRLTDAERYLAELITPLTLDMEAADRRAAIAEAAQAIDVSQRAVQARYHEQLAACYTAQALWEDARTELETTLELDGKRVEPYVMLADLESREFKDVSSAVARLHTMVRENPKDARAYMFRGTFRLRQVLEWERTMDVERLASVVEAERAQAAGVPAGTDSADGGAAAAPAATPDGAAPVAPSSVSLDPLVLKLELEDLALADSRRAAELAPDDSDVVLLAMQCEHRYRNLEDRAAAAVHLQAAKSYADRAIALSEQEFQKRRTEYAAEAAARRSGAGGATGQSGGAGQGTQEQSLSAEDLKRLGELVYRPIVSAYNTLADVALFEGQTAEAMSALDRGLKVLPSEESLLVNLANLQIASSDASAQAAANALVKTLKERPETVPLSDYLAARLDIVQGNAAGGLAKLETVRPDLNRWPLTAIEADRWIGECQLRLGNPQAAVAAFDLVLERRPDSIAARIGLVQALQQLGTDRDLDRALALNEDLLNRHEEIEDSGEQLALCFRYARAWKSRHAGLAADHPAWDRLLGYLQQVRANLQSNPVALAEMDVLEADVQLSRRRGDEAEAVLRAGVERNPRSARLWSALAWVQEHDAATKLGGEAGAGNDEALETLAAAEAAVTEPSPDDRVTLAMARVRHVLIVRPDEAPAELRRRTDEALAAEAAAAAALNAAPDSEPLQAEHAAQLRMIRELGGLAISIQEVAMASELFERLRQADPRDIGTLLVLFDLQLNRTFPEDLSPDALKAEQKEQIDSLSELLKSIKEVSGESAVWHYGNAVQAVLIGDNLPAESDAERQAKIKQYDAAIAELTQATSKGTASGRMLYVEGEIHDRKQRLQRQLGDSQWKASFENATKRYMAAFNAGLRSPELIFTTLRHLRESGQESEAADLLTRLGDQAPNLLETAQTAAAFSAELGRLDLANLAERYARRVTESDEGAQDPVAQLTFGDILVQQGQLDEAEQAYDRVRDLAPANVQVWRSLIAGYSRIDAERRKSRPEATQDALQQKCLETLAAAKGVLNETDFRLLEGRTYTRLGSLGEARSRYEAELAKVPADLKSATAEQIQLLMEAATLYIQQLGAADAEAFKTGEALLRRLDEEGPAAYEALRKARQGLGTKARISREEEALAQAIPDARRVLATLLMGRGDAASLEGALAVLDRNRNNGYSDADRRIEALILSRLPDPKPQPGGAKDVVTNKEKAIGLLESIINSSLRPSVADRLLLATMHLAEQRTASQRVAGRERVDGPDDKIVIDLQGKVERHLRLANDQTQAILFSGARETGGRNGAPSGPYVAALLQQIEIELLRDRTSEAHAWLSELKDLSRDPTGVVPIEARILFAEGNRHEEVRALLAGVIDRATDQTRLQAHVSVAQLLESFGGQLKSQGTATGDSAAVKDESAAAEAEQYLSLAEKVLVSSAKEGPSEQLRLAVFLGRHGRLEQGLALARSVVDSATDGDLAAASAQLMSSLGKQPDQLPQLQEFLAASREKYPDTIPLKMMDADLKAWSQDAAGAEALYREILAESPRNGVAINNLAYLLASQKKQLDEALELMNGLIDRSGGLPDLLDTRGYVYLQRNEPTQALADFAEAVGENGRPAPAFLFHQTQALLTVGKTQEAVASWNRAERAGLTETDLHPAERGVYRDVKSQVDALKGVAKLSTAGVRRSAELRIVFDRTRGLGV